MSTFFDDDYIPTFVRPAATKSPGKAGNYKNSYLSESELWVVLTDIEMEVCSRDIKNPPSSYQIGMELRKGLARLEEQGKIPSEKDAVDIMHSPARTCIKYMRGLIDPRTIKVWMKDEFPDQDVNALLDRIKNECKEEYEQYNRRMSIRNYYLTTHEGRAPSSPYQKSPERPTRSTSEQNLRTPEKSPYRGRAGPKITFSNKIEKFDMSTVKKSDELIGKVVPFEKVKWARYTGYKLYATKNLPLFLHKDNMQELKDGGYDDLPQLIEGKITKIIDGKANDNNRYELAKDALFGIALVSF